MPVRIHPTAQVASNAQIGEDTQIWLHCQIREDVVIGAQCVFGKNVYVDAGVRIGSRVKIQNNVSVFHGVTIEDGVFVGPHVCFTNDLVPRAINPDGTLKSASDWIVTETTVGYGAAIGANATIVCGVKIGAWAIVGSGSVVTKDVPDYALVVGCPAKVIGWVAPTGERMRFTNGKFVTAEGVAFLEENGAVRRV